MLHALNKGDKVKKMKQIMITMLLLLGAMELSAQRGAGMSKEV